MLETHDPDWQTKWDRAYAMMRELEVRDWSSLTADDHNRLDKLRRLLPVAFDASHRTANEYIDLHLSLTLKEADQLGIWAWLPRLPDDADIDATRAAVAEVNTYIDTVKHRRETFAHCRRAGIKPATSGRYRNSFGAPVGRCCGFGSVVLVVALYLPENLKKS